MDSLQYMKSLPDKVFDLLLTDPPWGIKATKMGYTRKQVHLASQIDSGTRYVVNQKGYTQKNWDNEPPSFETFQEMFRISRHQIIFGVDHYTSIYPFGPGRIQWDKMVPKSVSFNGIENAYCSLITGTDVIKCMWNGMMQAKSVDEPTVQQGNKKLNEKRIHPTQKPVILGRLILRKYAQLGWHIGDMYSGSGSFLLAAKLEGLPYTGVEKEKEYFDKAQIRLL